MFVHSSIERHPIIGKVKVYSFDQYPRIFKSGERAHFFHNNAEVNNKTQFALKLFHHPIEAFAAFQRQQLAAEKSFAPPVGQMIRCNIKVTAKNKTRMVEKWGYETGLADISKNSVLLASIIGSPWLIQQYAVFCKKNSKIKPYSIRSINSYWKSIDEDASMESLHSRTALCHIRDRESLRYKMAAIDITDTQYDDLSGVLDMGMPWDNRLTIGETWKAEDGAVMANDLHSENIGLWNGNPVVIDFGFHICCPFYYDEPRCD